MVFTIIDIDLETGSGGRGRVETPVFSFATRAEAVAKLAARRKEEGQREIPSFIRQTEVAPSTRVTQSREELKEELRRSEAKARSPEKQREIDERQERNIEKAAALADINRQIERSSPAERAELVEQRKRVSNIPLSQFTEERVAEVRRGRPPTTTTEVFERAEPEKERFKRGVRAVVSTGADFTEATLDLRPSGAVVGFGSRAVLEQAEPEQARDMFAPSFVPSRKTEAQETILRPSQEIFFPTEKPRGEVRAEPELDFAGKIRREGIKLEFKSQFKEEGARKILPTLAAAGLGFAGFFAFAVTHPIQFIKGSFETIRHPIRTIGQITTQAKISPAFTAGEIGAVVVTGKLGGKVARATAKRVVQPKMAAISTFKPTRKPGVTKTTPIADVQTVSTTKKLSPFGEPLSEKALMSLDKPIVTEKKLVITVSDIGKVTREVVAATKRPPKILGEPARIVSGETGAAGFAKAGLESDLGKTMFPGLSKEITKPKGRGKLGELFGGERQQLVFVEEQIPISKVQLIGMSKLKIVQPSLTKVRAVAGVFAAQKLTRFTGVGAIPKQLTTLKAIQTPVTRLIQRPSTKIAQAQLSITKPISDVKSITELKPLTATILTPVISPVIKSLSRLDVRQEVLSRTQLRTIQQLKPFPRAAPFTLFFYWSWFWYRKSKRCCSWKRF